MFQKQLTGRVLLDRRLRGDRACDLALSAAPARAERLGDERACVTAFKKAKEHEGSGKLQESKDQLMSCAQAPCSSFIRQQCSSKYNQLESDTPSVVLIVTDASGSPRGDIRSAWTVRSFAQQLDGRALSVDPGMHEFTFAADGVVFATQKIMIVQGQRNRFITALLRAGGGKSKAHGRRGARREAGEEGRRQGRRRGVRVGSGDEVDQDRGGGAPTTKAERRGRDEDRGGAQEERLGAAVPLHRPRRRQPRARARRSPTGASRTTRR